MDAWAGMERLLHLSMGIQVGASGVALIAVLELKRRLQYPVEFQAQPGTSPCIIRLTAEEWRSVAGIHVRKTFERTKAKLEELGILRIVRSGKLLEVTLWPEPEEATDVCTHDPIHIEIQQSSQETHHNTQIGLPIRPGKIRNLKQRLLDETDHETNLGTSCGTELGTRGGTKHETGIASMSKRVLRLKGDEVFLKKDVNKNVAYPTLLDKPALPRYPLNRQDENNTSKINNVSNVNNVSNAVTMNGQHYHERRSAPPSNEISVVEFAIHWVEETGHALTPYEKEGLIRFMRLGYTEELFVEALRCAVAADNRKMGYVMGILRNWYQQGVRCLQDVEAVKKSWDDLRFVKRVKTS